MAFLLPSTFFDWMSSNLFSMLFLKTCCFYCFALAVCQNNTLHKKQVFVDQAVRDFMKPFDFLCMQSLRLKDSFPNEFDQSVIKVLSTIHIDRHKKDSFTCGFFEGLFGQVMFCLSGQRLCLGLRVEPLTFKHRFSYIIETTGF